MLSKIPKIPKKKKSADVNLCPKCCVSSCTCDCEDSKSASLESVSCSVSSDFKSSNQNLPQTNSNIGQTKNNSKNDVNKTASLTCDKTDELKKDDRLKKRSKSSKSSLGEIAGKRRNSSQSLLQMMDSIRKSKKKNSSSKNLESRSRYGSAEGLLDEDSEILGTPDSTIACDDDDDDDDVFVDSNTNSLGLCDKGVTAPTQQVDVTVYRAAVAIPVVDTEKVLPTTAQNSPVSYKNADRTVEKLEDEMFRVTFTPGKGDVLDRKSCVSKDGKESASIAQQPVFNETYHPNLDKGIVHGLFTDDGHEEGDFVPDPERAVEMAGKGDLELRMTVSNDAPQASVYRWISEEQLINLCLHG